MSKPSIAIFGAGGHARVLQDAIAREGKYDLRCIIVDDDALAAVTNDFNVPIVRVSELTRDKRLFPEYFIVALGDNAKRRDKFQLLEASGLIPATVIHPYSCIALDARIGRGVYIAAGAVIDVAVVIGDGVIVNINAGVGHETTLGDFAHVGPGVLYGAISSLGAESFIGMGAIVISGCSVGQRSMVGSGALVNKSVPDDCLAIGSPARFRSLAPEAECIWAGE